MEVLWRGAFGMDAKRGLWVGPPRPWMAHRDDPRNSAGARGVERSITGTPSPGCRVCFVKAIHGLHPSGRLKPSRFAPGESVSLVTFCASKEIRSAAK